MSNGEHTAFPASVEQCHSFDAETGMTLREYHAAKAMQGWIVALSKRHKEDGYTDKDAAAEAARLAVFSADALLEWLEK